MADNVYKTKYLNLLKNKFGKVTKIGNGYNLFLVNSLDVIIYFRYSKILGKEKSRPYTFYGLRKDDIELIKKSNKKSFILLITTEEDKNLFIPFNYFEHYFYSSKSSNDGQYKINHYFKSTGNIIHFSKYGKYSTEKFQSFDSVLNTQTKKIKIPSLSHGQIQSLIGAIGIQQGYDLFFPAKDHKELDYAIINNSNIRKNLPSFNNVIDRIIREIDVIWLNGNKPEQMFES